MYPNPAVHSYSTAISTALLHTVANVTGTYGELPQPPGIDDPAFLWR